MAGEGKSTLVLKINDAEFNRPKTDDANDYKVFINKAVTLPAKVELGVSNTAPEKVQDRYQETFIKHVNEVLTDVNIKNTNWTETNTKNKLNTFLGINDSKASTTEFVVSVQVALIKAANVTTQSTEKNTYAADQIAVIQFPLFITTPGGGADAARGGRRRTKISKRHSTDRTRKNKFTTQN